MSEPVKLTKDEQISILILHRNVLANQLAVFEANETLRKSQDSLVQGINSLPKAHAVEGNFNLDFNDMTLVPVA